MEMVAYQPELSPALPVVLGNVDYQSYKATLQRIDEILCKSGVEKTFIQYYLAETERRYREQATQNGLSYVPPGAKETAKLEEHAVLALRCNIIRSMESISCRRLSQRLADSPLLQWFCNINRMDVIRVPSKSAIDRYAKAVPESKVRELVYELIRTAANCEEDGRSRLGLQAPLSLTTLLLDTTCVKANIHFPVDWVLLRDAARTLMKAIIVIRRHGLKNRIADPTEFIRDINRLCIKMTHTRRRRDSRKYRKEVLRLMKKLLRRIDSHARRYRDLLAEDWRQTDLAEGDVRYILSRIDGIRDQLSAAIDQAHERIIGGRKVRNKDKILSLYEPDIHVIVRGKSGSEVEFGNTFLLGEQKAGAIVVWGLIKESRSDSKMIKDSIERFRLAYGQLPGAMVTDRGFDSPGNREFINGNSGMYDSICPKSPTTLRERMKESQFRDLQRRRSQTEGRIGIFKNVFLGRPFRSKGFVNRELNITWSVLSHNLWVIARLPQANDNRNRLQQAA